jgi:hypothetical protein
MFNTIFSIEVWMPDSDFGGIEFINELSVPIPPYIGMEIYHSGYEMYVDYIAIEYDDNNNSKINCILKTYEDATIYVARCLLDNGWKLNPNAYEKDELIDVTNALIETSNKLSSALYIL